MRQLLVQSIKTPDGTILTSRHRHDYVTHIDAISGEMYMVDGGNSYRRGTVNKVPATDLCVYTDDSHEKIREAFTWGSRGKSGNEPLTYITLSSLTADHILAILRTQRLSEDVEQLFYNELNWRDSLKGEAV